MIALLQLVHDTLDAVALLNKNGRITQALILVYATIDTLAWLSTPNPNTSRTSFRHWVDDYLLPGSALLCNSDDLYSARCGLLHTHAAESSGTRADEAHQIWYWTGEDSRKLLEYQAGSRTDVVFVRVADLVDAFLNGAERFASDLSSDPARAAVADDKMRRWLAWVPAPPAV